MTQLYSNSLAVTILRGRRGQHGTHENNVASDTTFDKYVNTLQLKALMRYTIEREN